MTKNELRDKFLKEIPMLIAKGNNCTYAEWLESLIISTNVVNENYLLQRVINCPFCGSNKTVSWGVNNDWNCTNCGKDFEGCL